MKLETLTDSLELGDLRCAECGQPATVVSVLVLAASGWRVRVCDDCLEGLRNIIRKTRGRRPLSPRSRRALRFLANTPAETASYEELAAAIGKYATNVILTLLERGLILAGDREHVKTSSFSLTPAGAAAVSTLELAAAGK